MRMWLLLIPFLHAQQSWAEGPQKRCVEVYAISSPFYKNVFIIGSDINSESGLSSSWPSTLDLGCKYVSLVASNEKKIELGDLSMERIK